MSEENTQTASICPLCHQANHCGNLSSTNSSTKSETTCWCADKSITFPESLLKQVPSSAKNKACICKACVLKHIEELAQQVN